MNKLAAIYARVSSDRQREDKTIASQTRSLREYAQVQGYTVPSEWVFEDEGYSGATLARPGLERLRDLVAEGQVQAVLVYGPDRLSRVAKYAFPFRCVPNSQALLPPSTRGTRLSCLKVPPSGGWKAPRTRTLESVRYVAQPFQAAGWRSFPAPQRAPACGGPWWYFQDAPLPDWRLLSVLLPGLFELLLGPRRICVEILCHSTSEGFMDFLIYSIC